METTERNDQRHHSLLSLASPPPVKAALHGTSSAEPAIPSSCSRRRESLVRGSSGDNASASSLLQRRQGTLTRGFCQQVKIFIVGRAPLP